MSTPNYVNAITHHSGCTWCKRWCTWIYITCSWCKRLVYINNCSIHSVGVGADSSRPSAPNCINATTHHSGCTWVNITCSWNKHWLYINNPQRTFRRRRGRFIAPVHTELYKYNHASYWLYVGKTLVVHGYPHRIFRNMRAR